MNTVIFSLIGLVIIIFLAIQVSEWDKNNTKKFYAPLEKLKSEYISKLKSWCEINNIEFPNMNFDLGETEIYYKNQFLTGDIWFDNKNIIFCPAYYKCGNPINIEDNVLFIPYSNIEYFTKDGTITYTNKVINNGKNISVSGTIVGAAIAGSTGAIIGSRKDANKIENVAERHDEVHTYIFFLNNNILEVLDVRGSNFFSNILEGVNISVSLVE